MFERDAGARLFLLKKHFVIKLPLEHIVCASVAPCTIKMTHGTSASGWQMSGWGLLALELEKVNACSY